MNPAIGNGPSSRRACRNKPFGTAGSVATPSLSGYSMAIAPDDKIVVGGRFYPTGASTDLGIARYTADGVLDTSFGDDASGIVHDDLRGGTYDYGFAVAVQPDGKIAAAGISWKPQSASGPTLSAVMVRHQENGDLDPTFGDGGVIVRPWTQTGYNYSDSAMALQIQPDGKVLAAGGLSSSYYESNITLARLSASLALELPVAVVPDAPTLDSVSAEQTKVTGTDSPKAHGPRLMRTASRSTVSPTSSSRPSCAGPSGREPHCRASFLTFGSPAIRSLHASWPPDCSRRSSLPRAELGRGAADAVS